MEWKKERINLNMKINFMKSERIYLRKQQSIKRISIIIYCLPNFAIIDDFLKICFLIGTTMLQFALSIDSLKNICIVLSLLIRFMDKFESKN